MAVSTNRQVLVETDWVEENLGRADLVVLDVDEDTEAYGRGHLPGALGIHWKDDLQDPRAARRIPYRGRHRPHKPRDHAGIDSHDAPVSEDVWQLYEGFVGRVGATPTLIERDGNIPPFAELMNERERAQGILGGSLALAA